MLLRCLECRQSVTECHVMLRGQLKCHSWVTCQLEKTATVCRNRCDKYLTTKFWQAACGWWAADEHDFHCNDLETHRHGVKLSKNIACLFSQNTCIWCVVTRSQQHRWWTSLLSAEHNWRPALEGSRWVCRSRHRVAANHGSLPALLITPIAPSWLQVNMMAALWFRPHLYLLLLILFKNTFHKSASWAPGHIYIYTYDVHFSSQLWANLSVYPAAVILLLFSRQVLLALTIHYKTPSSTA